ncbi:MAG: dihydrofolate reductase [Sediminibacterium sp.]|nr:dihydrofolate reductase [Sediminibacterium sp.]
MIIAAIVATDLKNAIGKNNKLLWHLPADLKFFKQVTMGYPIIMGRKTFESIGRLLPGRKNIIITRNKSYTVEGAEVVDSIKKALKSSVAEEKVFIIGGAEIYTQAMPHIKELYRTLVKHEFDADTFFPRIDHDQFNLIWQECHEANETNTYGYCFQKYERVK